MKYQQIIPATDWYYRFEMPLKGTPHYMLLAAFALNEAGQVVGLVSVSPPPGSKAQPPSLLVEPAYTTSGYYVHKSQVPLDEVPMLTST